MAKTPNLLNSQTLKSKLMSELLQITIQEKASDLHLSVGQPPVLRVDGKLVPLAKKAPITKEVMQELVASLLNEEQRKKLVEEREIDFSYTVEEGGRFRGNIFFEI